MWDDEDDDDEVCEPFDPMRGCELALLNVAHPDWADYIRMSEDGSIAWTAPAMAVWLAGPGNRYRLWASSEKSDRAIRFMDRFKAWKAKRPQAGSWKECPWKPEHMREVT